MSEVTTWSQQLLEKSKTKHWATHIFFGDEPPADLYLIWCIKSWILHILRGHTIQHWRLPDPKSSTVNKQHNSWTILRPNPTQLKTVKTKKFKKNFDRSLFQKLRKKKKEKESQPKKQDSARQSIIIIIKTTWKTIFEGSHALFCPVTPRPRTQASGATTRCQYVCTAPVLQVFIA